MLETAAEDLVETALARSGWYATRSLETNWPDPARIRLGDLLVITGPRSDRSPILAGLVRSLASTASDLTASMPRSLFLAPQDGEAEATLRVAGLLEPSLLPALQNPQNDEQRASRRALGDRLRVLDLVVLGADSHWERDAHAFITAPRPHDLLAIDDADFDLTAIAHILGSSAPLSPQTLPRILRHFARQRMCSVVIGLNTLGDQANVWQEHADRIIHVDDHLEPGPFVTAHHARIDGRSRRIEGN